MSSNNKDLYIVLSKTLSFYLRHKPEELYKNKVVKLEEDGYLEMSLLLESEIFQNSFKNKYNKEITDLDIKNVVNINEKKRFEISNDGKKIRCVQGHNKDIKLDDEKYLEEVKEPYETLIHGTNKKAYEIIKTKGLSIMNRRHIHFVTNNNSKEVISGYRNSSNVFIYLDMKKCMDDKIIFYKSKNNVILSSGLNGIIEPKYFKMVIIDK